VAQTAAAVALYIRTAVAVRHDGKNLSAVAHDGTLPRAHSQQPTVGGSPTAVGHGGWPYPP
jgi:hypothetical protein